MINYLLIIINQVMIKNSILSFSSRSLMNVKNTLEESNMTETTYIASKNIVAAIYKSTGAFHGLEFNANDNEVTPFYFDQKLARSNKLSL